MRTKTYGVILAIAVLLALLVYFTGVRVERADDNQVFANSTIQVDENSIITAMNSGEPIDPDFGNWKNNYKHRVYHLQHGEQSCYILLGPDDSSIDCPPTS